MFNIQYIAAASIIFPSNQNALILMNKNTKTLWNPINVETLHNTLWLGNRILSILVDVTLSTVYVARVAFLTPSGSREVVLVSGSPPVVLVRAIVVAFFLSELYFSGKKIGKHYHDTFQ